MERVTAHSLEHETRNGERNANRIPEWWGDFSQLVKIGEIKFLGISRYKVELRFRILRYLPVQIQIEIFVQFEFAVD